MNKGIKELILSTIMGAWHSSKLEDGEILFFKHIDADKKNKIFQVILAGTEFDGVYELYTTKSLFQGYINEDDKEVVISVKDNLDYALFKGELAEGYLNPESCRAYGNCIIRSEYKDEQSFRKALLETGLVTNEEYDIYTHSESKDYIYKKSPKIRFE